jgi:DNA-binding NtrC family response regulator
VVVDGASATEHDLGHWQDELRSPLRLADGGTLVVLDLPTLPAEAQEYLARAISSAKSHASSVPPAGLIATTRGGVPALFARLAGNREIALPALADRAEDLRALILDSLAREGLRKSGEPLGVDFSALRLLSEHTWPGNDLELESLLRRAAAVASGTVVTAADLAVIGFRPTLETLPASPPLPEVLPRSRARRVPRRRG